MIIHLKKGLNNEEIAALAAQEKAIHFTDENRHVLVLSAQVKSLPTALEKITDTYFVTPTDIQLASKEYIAAVREIELGSVTIGGNSQNTVMMAGPCSVESETQMEEVAKVLQKNNIKIIRGGCFKPRTSPYTFQGLGHEGLKILLKIKEKYGFQIITEVKDSSHVDYVIEHADIIQIGAKAMYDHSIGKKCGMTKKPVMLKRGFGTTLQEFVQAAEFILSAGNPNVFLCERGIRTFENQTRFTLDLCGVAFLKEKTNLPIVVDPSHAMGYRYGVADLTRAALAMGIDGLIIEAHPNPEKAQSDAAQQLNLNAFEILYKTLQPIASAIGRNLV